MPEAARLEDPISHSAALGGLIAGALIGGLIAVAVVVTAPVSVPALIGGAVIAGAAVGGAGVGELLGSLSFARSTTGAIDSPGSPTVKVNGRKAARAHLDTVVCSNHSGKPVIAQGSATVKINGQPAARKNDLCACGAVIEDGSQNVKIGGATATTDDISPEVPGFVHTAMLVVGVASAAILFGPAVAAAGLIGGMVGGAVMNKVGGAIFGEGSDGQKLMAFGGAMAGGFLGGKGGAWFDRNYQVSSSGLGANGGNIRVTRRPPSSRDTYMGGTPDKFSRTGLAVVERMRGEGRIMGEGSLTRGNPNDLMLRAEDGTLTRIDHTVDMAHRTDAVTWWNETGRFTGAKSPTVREFMLDPNNYELQPRSINRSEGASLGETYQPPVIPDFSEPR